MFKNILVAVDGSEHSLKAARIAGDLARNLHADLWLLVAYDPIPEGLGEPNLQAAMTARMEATEKIVTIALTEIGKIPGIIKREVLEGPPSDAILSVAETRSVDLIIMGTRGLGRLASMVIGSQSQKVTAQAECPVMLVR